MKDYPKLKADVEKQMKETKRSAQPPVAWAEEAKRKIQELAKQAQQPPPAPTEPPLDPGLNPFGDQPAHGHSAASVTGSLWSALKKQDASQNASTLAPPATYDR